MSTSLAARRTFIPRARIGPATSLVVPLVVGAVAFLWQLGASSLFVDETSSWRVAAASIGSVFRIDRATEVAPPTYYLLLHFWIRALGSDSEWTMRLFSVLAGIGLVAAVWWLARIVAGNTAAFLAALITALSPLVVEYAQEVRAYVFAMLCVTIAVAAAIRSTHSSDHGTRWVAVSAAASVAAIWLHYTGLLVILPLAVFVWMSESLSVSAKRAYILVCAAGLLIVSPVMVIQLRAGHQGGVAPYAQPTLTNLLRVVGSPFDGRFAPLVVAYLTGALAVAFAVLVSALSPQTRRLPDRRLVLAAAVTPLVAVVGINIAAKLFDERTYYSLITRYTAVAVPFMIVTLAWTLVAIPRPAGVGLAGVLIVSIVSGLHATYSSQTLQPNMHAAVARIVRGYRAGDTVVLTGAVAHSFDPDYYVASLRTQRPQAVIVRTAGTSVAVPSAGTRIWVVFDTGSATPVAAALSRAGWHTVQTAGLDPDLELVLARHG